MRQTTRNRNNRMRLQKNKKRLLQLAKQLNKAQQVQRAKPAAPA